MLVIAVFLHSTADCADNHLVVVGQLGQFAGLQDVLIELLVVVDRKDHLVQSLEYLDVVLSYATEFNPTEPVESDLVRLV